MQVSRTVILKISDPNTGRTYPIMTAEHIAMNCGEVIKNLIEGDGTSTEYQFTLPGIKCLDILWMFFRVGQVPSFIYIQQFLLYIF